jgi:hypothetical protein
LPLPTYWAEEDELLGTTTLDEETALELELGTADELLGCCSMSAVQEKSNEVQSIVANEKNSWFFILCLSIG